MSTAENIKKLREMHGLSQAELGKVAGVSDKAVSTWESGKKMPRMGALQRIADYFGIQKSNIIEDNGLECPGNDLDKADAAFLADYKELTEENKATLRAMAQLMRHNQAEK